MKKARKATMKARSLTKAAAGSLTDALTDALTGVTEKAHRARVSTEAANVQADAIADALRIATGPVKSTWAITKAAMALAEELTNALWKALGPAPSIKRRSNAATALANAIIEVAKSAKTATSAEVVWELANETAKAFTTGPTSSARLVLALTCSKAERQTAKMAVELSDAAQALSNALTRTLAKAGRKTKRRSRCRDGGTIRTFHYQLPVYFCDVDHNFSEEEVENPDSDTPTIKASAIRNFEKEFTDYIRMIPAYRHACRASIGDDPDFLECLVPMRGHVRGASKGDNPDVPECSLVNGRPTRRHLATGKRRVFCFILPTVSMLMDYAFAEDQVDDPKSDEPDITDLAISSLEDELLDYTSKKFSVGYMDICDDGLNCCFLGLTECDVE